MQRIERAADTESAWRAVLGGFQGSLWTALPGIVQAFDAQAQTCVVQPALREPVRDASGRSEPVTLPLLTDCPVVFPGGGGCTLTFPLQQGDECLVVFASRCIDGWWEAGGVATQRERRMHDLSDGFVLAGVRSRPRALAEVSTTTAQLRSDDGQTVVDMDPAGGLVNIKAPAGIVLDAPMVTLTGAVQVQNSQGAGTACAIRGTTQFEGTVLANGRRIDDTHVHSGVSAGGSTSGPVA
ncbi:Phage-related protein [plant metagenome]